jgi:hypothetical protein
MKEKSTEVFIQSSPEKVWKVLTDFSGWKDWNPIIYEIEGAAKLGNKLRVTLKGKDGKAGTVLKPIITLLENQKKMVWTQLLAGGLLYETQKIIELENSGGGTRIVHKELFGGLLPILTWATWKNAVEPMLNEANHGLKKKMENQNN